MLLLFIPVYSVALESARTHSLVVLNSSLGASVRRLNEGALSLLQIDSAMNASYVSEVRRSGDAQFNEVLDYKLIQCRQLFSQLTRNIFGPSTCYMLFHNNSRVISSGDSASIYTSHTDFFGKYVRYASADPDALSAMILSCRNGATLLPADSISINFFPARDCFTAVFYSSGSSATVCALYTLSDIADALGLSELPEGTGLRMESGDGVSIFRLGGEEDAPNATLLSYRLEVLDASITLSIPPDYFTAQVSSVLRLIIRYICWALALGFVISLLLSFYNYRPLYLLTKLATGAEPSSLPTRDEFTNLTASTLNARRTQAELADQVSVMQQTIHDSHLERLLVGKASSADVAAADRFLPELKKMCRLALVDVGGDRSEEAAERIILLALPFFETKKLHLRYIGYGQILSLFDESLTERFEQAMTETNQVVLEHCDSQACAILSEPFSGVAPLQRIFHTLQIASISAGRPITYADAPAENEEAASFAAPDLESFCSSIRGGNGYAAESIVNSALTALVKNRSPYAHFVRLFDMLRSALVTTSDKLNVPFEAPVFVENAPILEQFDRLSGAARSLAETQNEKKTVPSYKNEMLAFIDAHFADGDMYAGCVAETFHISTKQVYRVVRELTGCGFSDYLENLRIQYAVHLLNDTDELISEIAIKSGFNSVSTFYKAFKRVYGVSPTTWRNGGKPENGE